MRKMMIFFGGGDGNEDLVWSSNLKKERKKNVEREAKWELVNFVLRFDTEHGKNTELTESPVPTWEWNQRRNGELSSLREIHT